MAKMSSGQKAERVLRLMLGLRHRPVAKSLARFGFSDAEFQRGLDLFNAFMLGKLAVRGDVAASEPRIVRELDAWENQWFPIADVVLAKGHPEAHAFVFLNLVQTSGPEVIVSVGTMLQRLAALPRAVDAGGLGEEGVKARELLRRRGLDDEAVEAASRILREFGTIEAEDVALDAQEDAGEANAVAEEALWDWYLEWSTIAQQGNMSRRLLRRLGFLKDSVTGAIEEDLDGDGVADEPSVPTPGAPAANVPNSS